MKKLLLISIVSFLLISCGTSKSTERVSKHKIDNSKIHSKTSGRKYVRPINERFPEIGDLENIDGEDEEVWKVKREIIDYAKTFQGTRYKFGGTTEAGMDCSGLVCVAFKKENINLPRISRDIATKGIPVSLKDIEPGDLIFFKTSSKNVISHVGLVVDAQAGDVRFIHSTTRAGVIISSLEEAYWKKAFVEVRRII